MIRIILSTDQEENHTVCRYRKKILQVRMAQSTDREESFGLQMKKRINHSADIDKNHSVYRYRRDLPNLQIQIKIIQSADEEEIHPVYRYRKEYYKFGWLKVYRYRQYHPKFTLQKRMAQSLLIHIRLAHGLLIQIRIIHIQVKINIKRYR